MRLICTAAADDDEKTFQATGETSGRPTEAAVAVGGRLWLAPVVQVQKRHTEKRVQPGTVAAGVAQVAPILLGADPSVELVPQQPRTQGRGRGHRRGRLVGRVVHHQPAVPADAGQPAARVQERLCSARSVRPAENAARRRERTRPAGCVARAPLCRVRRRRESREKTKFQPQPVVAGAPRWRRQSNQLAPPIGPARQNAASPQTPSTSKARRRSVQSAVRHHRGRHADRQRPTRRHRLGLGAQDQGDPRGLGGRRVRAVPGYRHVSAPAILVLVSIGQAIPLPPPRSTVLR